MVALALATLLAPALAGDTPEAPGEVPLTARVVSVYDGDTVTLDTGDRVRLQWVNTPELKPAEDYGVEARELAARLVLNKRVRLSYGPVVRDGYGRLIAGITTESGDRLALELLKAGYGHLFIIPPVAESDLQPLLDAQMAAQDAGRGIWSDDRYRGALHITSFHANARGDDRENLHGEYLRVCNVGRETIDLDGYRLTDLNGNSWRLPPVQVPVGYTFKLVSGRGTNQTSLDQQLEIFLQTDDPVWSNRKDRATLYDPTGKVLDTRLHAPKSQQ